jgi:environmental stress-induced protein Ves
MRGARAGLFVCGYRAPMPPRLIRLDDAEPQPWRNGGGVRRDLIHGPAEDDWQWRVSVAEIAANGPFSPFPGVERWFAVVRGAGVDLAFAGAMKRVTRNSPPLCFDGEAAPPCSLIDGPAVALNLLLRGGIRGALAVAMDAEPWRPEAAECGLFTAVGGVCKGGEHETEMPANALLWFDRPPPELRFVGGQRRASVLGWWIRVGSAVAR